VKVVASAGGVTTSKPMVFKNGKRTDGVIHMQYGGRSKVEFDFSKRDYGVVRKLSVKNKKEWDPGHSMSTAELSKIAKYRVLVSKRDAAFATCVMSALGAFGSFSMKFIRSLAARVRLLHFMSSSVALQLVRNYIQAKVKAVIGDSRARLFAMILDRAKRIIDADEASQRRGKDQGAMEEGEDDEEMREVSQIIQRSELHMEHLGNEFMMGEEADRLQEQQEDLWMDEQDTAEQHDEKEESEAVARYEDEKDEMRDSKDEAEGHNGDDVGPGKEEYYYSISEGGEDLYG
jgi:hypothetical protein